jgi:tetratricopeptide (TPR) repeat protein
MDTRHALINAIKVLWNQFPELIGEDWSDLEPVLRGHLQLLASEEQGQAIHQAVILGQISRYPRAHQQLTELIAEFSGKRISPTEKSFPLPTPSLMHLATRIDHRRVLKNAQIDNEKWQEQLDHAIQARRGQVGNLSADLNERINNLDDLGIFLVAHAEHTASGADLEEAVQVFADILTLASQDYLWQMIAPFKMASVLSALYTISGRGEYIEQALDLFQTAYDNASNFGIEPFLSEILYQMGLLLIALYNRTGRSEYLDGAIENLQQSVNLTSLDAPELNVRTHQLRQVVRARIEKIPLISKEVTTRRFKGPWQDDSPLPPRYLNVCLTKTERKIPVPSSVSLGTSQNYHLRIDIGELSVESVVENAILNPFPADKLPGDMDGHWLEVVIVSDDFKLARSRYHLFLPNIGSSWVCDCTPGQEHNCIQSARHAYLFVPVSSPSAPGPAELRIGLYYANNLVQSQLLSAEILPEERVGAGYRSWIDYTLTAQLKKVDFLTSRSLNILTNRNQDGSHRLVIKNGLEDVMSFNLTEGQIRSAINNARATLFGIHIEEYGGQLGAKPQRRNLFDENNAKGKDDFVKDLITLAQVGWNLWAALYQTHPSEGHHLRAIMAQREMSIQVARVRGSVFVFPWALLYDIPIESDGKYQLCRLLNEFEDMVSLLEEGYTKCPYESEHQESNYICPFGFWGFRHIIEQPPSTENSDLPIPIESIDPLEIVVCRSLDLDQQLSEDHLKQIHQMLPSFELQSVTSRDEIRDTLSNPSLEVVYFYCHSKREEQPGMSAPIPYLEVGWGERITPADITAWHLSYSRNPAHWKTKPLVFINGCHTTELSPEALVNFVDAFSSANAGGVIGTEITLDQRLANEAAEQILGYFARKKSVGESIRRMRLHFLRKGNLLGLAYTPFCSADLKLVITQH